MIITISGALGSGKTTVADLLAKRLKIKRHSVGSLMRDMARERKTSLLKLSRQAETDSSIDRELDKKQIQLGKEKDNFIIDGRLSWHFIPDSFKIFLDVNDKEAAKRIFKARRSDEKYNTTLKKTLQNIKKRKTSEIKRYRHYYGLNYYNKKNYDLVIDTTDISAEEAAKDIFEKLKAAHKNI
ncbi:cytidylate kinase family protein [archaeon]|nr:cytidylate kinase family protein [archaeon]